MGSVFLRGNSYVIEYRDRGKTKRESVGKKGIVTKSMAREVLNKREQQIKRGEYDLLDSKIPTLNEFAIEYLKYVRDVAKKRSWKRDEGILKHLKFNFGNRRLSEISSKDIDDYKNDRLLKVEPATVNRELSLLRYLLNLAKRWKKFFGVNPVCEAGLITVNNQTERILTLEEEQRLLTSSNPKLRVILICALHTGMRKSEILTLKWDSVDLDTNIITIQHTNT